VWWRLADALRLGGQVVRGLVAGAVLLALVAGVPWALWHYIGWPLPSHVPTWVEMQGVLLSPLTITFLLDFLACLCWFTWAAFTIDVLRCTVDLARSGFDAAWLPEFSAAGPMRAVVGVLVGAVLLAVLGNRPAPAPAVALSTTLGTGSHVVATASALQHPGPGGEAVVHNAVFATHTTAGRGSIVSGSAHPDSVVVLAPQNGVHDSLWRIAQRTLGDGARWPEIFDLNKGKPQPNGHTFTQPSLIFPGEELALPRDASAPAVPPPQQADPDQTPPTPPSTPPLSTPPPTTSAPPTSIQPSTPTPPAPSTQQAPPAATGTNTAPGIGDSVVRWGAELFVGLGLAAAISAALLVARRRYRSRYRPSSGDRDDLPVAPVVYQLRLAHLRAEADNEIDVDEDYPDEEKQERPRCVPPAPPLVLGTPRTGAGRPSALTPGLGVRDGREVALDLAAARGLGLVGAGAPAAARALLVAALTSVPSHLATSARAIVIVPADDLASVLGRGARQDQLPSTVQVMATVEDALDAVEAETLVRASASREHDTAAGAWPPLMLVARPPAHPQRLQAVLDNGAPFGVTGLLPGPWQPGVTCYVRDDGTISATSPGLGEALRGTRMFRLGDEDTAELLALLHQAETNPPTTDDHVVAPPVRRPRIVSPHSAGNDRTAPGADTAPEPVASNAGEVELEVTAAVTPAAPPDELEILGPAQGQPHGVRLRPPATRRQPPAASRLVEDEETEHRHLGLTDEPASTGEPARSAPETPSGRTTDSEQDPTGTLITVDVLGGLRVHWHPDPGTTGGREITGTLQPRTKELLVLLALHPDGATRETLISALWGHDPPARPTNALHTALSRLRHALAAATDGAVTDIVSASNGRYQLDSANVRSDYWRFARAVTVRRAAATDQARVEAYRDVVNSYGGPLAEGMGCEWLEPAREAIRRDAIDAVSALARALVDSDPQQTLDLLEVARAFDPHNELLYRDIMRLQERLGQLDAIPRTLTLLTTRLAEIDAVPTPQARALATRLGQRHEDDPAGTARSRTRSERGRSAAS
jgi:DNA-binding SARP family transcriptional activator